MHYPKDYFGSATEFAAFTAVSVIYNYLERALCRGDQKRALGIVQRGTVSCRGRDAVRQRSALRSTPADTG